jgi:hypothetical protein
MNDPDLQKLKELKKQLNAIVKDATDGTLDQKTAADQISDLHAIMEQALVTLKQIRLERR